MANKKYGNGGEPNEKQSTHNAAEGTDTPCSADQTAKQKRTDIFTRIEHSPNSTAIISQKAGAKPKRRWFQFSLRTFLVLLTIFGVWLGLHVRSVRKQNESVAAIKRLGGWYYYDFQNYDPTTHKVDVNATSWVPAWLLSYLGEDFFHDVVMVQMAFNEDTNLRLDNDLVTDEVLHYLDGVPHLTGLYLHKGQATDAGMKYVGTLKELRVLFIWDGFAMTDAGIGHLGRLVHLTNIFLTGSKIGDESLQVIAGLPRIERMCLYGTPFTDAGLAHLKGTTRLTFLSLGCGTEVTDAGLAHLAGLTELEYLCLQEVQATNKGLEHLKGLSSLKLLYITGVDDTAALQKALPNCKINK